MPSARGHLLFSCDFWMKVVRGDFYRRGAENAEEGVEDMESDLSVSNIPLRCV